MSVKLDLSHITKRKTHEVLSTLHSIKTSIEQINQIPIKKSRTRAFIEIKKHANLSTLDSDTISIKNGDKKYSIIFDSVYNLQIIERGIKSKHIERNISLNNGNIVKAEGFIPKKSTPEVFLNEVFELFESTFLELRKTFSNKKFSEFINSFKIPKSLNQYNQTQVDEIIALYKSVDKKILSIQNPQTRSNVKNGFHNIKKGIYGSKQLDFRDINGKSYSVNILVDNKKKSNLVIGITENDQTKYIIVEPDGKILKSKKINKRHYTGDKTTYYPENEVNSSFITNALIELKSELINYDKFVTKRLNELELNRYKYSTDEIGVIKNAVIDKLIDIREKRSSIQVAMKWLKNEHRRNAKERLGIQLGNGKNHAIIIKRVGPYKETVHLSFPIIDNTPCTKILILNRNKEVEKTYLIKEQNLIKFEAKNTSFSKWANTIFHYHSQDEIDNSSLNLYADEIQTRMTEISKIIEKKDWYK